MSKPSQGTAKQRVLIRATEIMDEIEKKGQAPPGRREQAPLLMTSHLKLYLKEQERKNLIESDSEFRRFVRQIIRSRFFNYFIMACVGVNAIEVALDDHSTAYQYAELVFFSVYCFEFILKFYVERKLYWQNSYNILDFVLLLISVAQLVLQTYFPYINVTYLRVIRGLRALRALRSISLFRSLQVIVNALGKTIKTSVVDVILLLFLVMFLFAVVGYHLFAGDNTIDDPNFDNLPDALLTLFDFVTCDGWTNRQQSLDQEGYALNRWFCMIFIFIGNFVFTNLFIAIICNNIQDATEAEKKNQMQIRKMAKQYKKEVFAKKQRDELVQLMAHQKKMQNSNLQQVFQSLAGQLHHDDIVPMNHLCCHMNWIETFMLTMNYHENCKLRMRDIHYNTAHILREVVDKREKEKNIEVLL